MHADGYVRVARLAAMKDAEGLASALDALGEPHDRSAAILRQHQITTLVRASLDSAPERARFDELIGAIDRLRRLPFLTESESVTGFSEVRERLSARGIDVLLLKGLYFAERLYGGTRWRPQFDVDVLIPSEARRRAHRLLVEAGFERTAYDLHSATFTRDRLKVDVHGWLRRAPAYRLDESSIWNTAQTVAVAGIQARTVSDEFALVMLILATFEDLGQGTTRLKHLLDAYLLLRRIDASTDWNTFFERRKREGIYSITATVVDAVVQLFDAAEDMPRIRRALDARHGSFPVTTRREMLELVFAPRKDPKSMAWFRRVYPGNLTRYLIAFWAGGFPANVTVPSLAHAFAAGRVAIGRRKL